MNEDGSSPLERKSRAAFDARVEAQDGATRARLARARAKALERVRRPRFGRAPAWVPVGAAAAALVAALLWQREEAGDAPVPVAAALAPDDLEIVAGGEDFDLLREDAEFLAWAAAQAADEVG